MFAFVSSSNIIAFRAVADLPISSEYAAWDGCFTVIPRHRNSVISGRDILDYVKVDFADAVGAGLQRHRSVDD